jgi:hypothetical protein
MDFKRGATFCLSGSVKNNGQVLDITGYTIQSKIKSKCSGAVFCTLGCSVIDASTGQISLSSPNDTDDWPIGIALMDVRVRTPAGQVIMSHTQEINIIDNVTSK